MRIMSLQNALNFVPVFLLVVPAGTDGWRDSVTRPLRYQVASTSRLSITVWGRSVLRTPRIFQ